MIFNQLHAIFLGANEDLNLTSEVAIYSINEIVMFASRFKTPRVIDYL